MCHSRSYVAKVAAWLQCSRAFKLGCASIIRHRKHKEGKLQCSRAFKLGCAATGLMNSLTTLKLQCSRAFKLGCAKRVRARIHLLMLLQCSRAFKLGCAEQYYCCSYAGINCFNVAELLNSDVPPSVQRLVIQNLNAAFALICSF